jgi:hypothetical protein
VLEQAPALLVRSDGRSLLYAGKRHSLYGEPESGKTWAALGASGELLIGNQHVVYLDFEDRASTVVGRLVELGISPEAILGWFHYIRPEEPLERQGRTDLNRVLALAPALAVLDGMTEAMTLHGLSPDANPDVAKFNERVVRPIADSGAAVVTIDHVTKSRDGRGRWAIGAQHKLAGIDGAAFAFEVVRPFGKGLHGVARIEVTKDRPGFVREVSLGGKLAGELHIFAQEGGTLAVEIRPVDLGTDETGLSPSRRWVLGVLPTEPVDGLTVEQIGDRTAEAGHPLKSNTIQKALGELFHRRLVDRDDGGVGSAYRWWRTSEAVP